MEIIEIIKMENIEADVKKPSIKVILKGITSLSRRLISLTSKVSSNSTSYILNYKGCYKSPSPCIYLQLPTIY